MDNLQRLSPYGRVKPQANGGRKILGLTAFEKSKRLTNSLYLYESIGVVFRNKEQVKSCDLTLTY